MEQKTSNKRIEELADFLYHSDNSDDVPLRIAVETGLNTGYSLSKKDFIKLVKILFNSKNLKDDLLKLRNGLSKKKFINGFVKIWREDFVKSGISEIKLFFENK